MRQTEKVRAIVSRLRDRYPDAECTLDYTEPWQLLISAILAAQCTDERVNKITDTLYRDYPSLEAFAKASQDEIEYAVRSCGLYRNKAKAIRASAKEILERFDGQVPSDFDELLSLPGVGRKIANLVVSDGFGQPAVVVDTHCSRITRLIGFTQSKNPTVIEKDLRRVLPEDVWTSWGHLLVAHGREICRARCRRCLACPISDLCAYGKTVLDEHAHDEASGECF